MLSMVAAAARKARPLDWLVPAVVTGSLVPFAVLLWRATAGALGANPIATALNQLGLLALVLLLGCLACTPLKIVTGWKWPIRIRRALGLMACFTVLAHFLVYLVLDQGMALGPVIADVIQRPFIAVGFTAFVLLVPLAWTSSKAALQRMGPVAWKRLHRLIYVIGILGVTHFLLRVKQDAREPVVYGAILALLLAVRLVDYLRRRR